MLLPWIVLISTTFLRLSVAHPHGQENVVDLGYVKYLGNRTLPNTNVFLGIPYAEPPLGHRRFRAPAPLNTRRISREAKGRVVNATEYPMICVQQSVTGIPNGYGTEDCLKLNIWAPAGAKRGDNFPVLVDIHGGGYVFGHQNSHPYDHWIERSPNIVVVKIAYRLGVFGFLATPSFNNPANGDFNAGLKDMTQALKWVKKYISRFGGDPSKVTISGISAGGGAIQLLLVAHGVQGLYHQAIGRSVWRGTLVSPENIQPLFEYIAAQVGCTRSHGSAMLACMRRVTPRQLSDAHDSIPTGFSGPFTRFMPTLDGDMFTEYPTHAFQGGRFAKVPLIVGATTDDGIATATIAQELHINWPLLTNQDINDIIALYPEADYPTPEDRLRAAIGESQFRCSNSLMGSAYSTQPVSFTYRYNEPQPGPPILGGGRVPHGAEIWMMHRGSKSLPEGQWEFTPMAPFQQAFAEELIAYFTSFIRSGDPNTYKLDRSPSWPPYTENTRNRIVHQADPEESTTTSGIIIELESQAETDRCAVIYTKADRQQN